MIRSPNSTYRDFNDDRYWNISNNNSDNFLKNSNWLRGQIDALLVILVVVSKRRYQEVK